MNEMNRRMHKDEVNRTALFALGKLSLLGIAINEYETLDSIRDIPSNVGEDDESIIRWVENLDEEQKAAWLNVIEAMSEAYIACSDVLVDYGIPKDLVEDRIRSKNMKKC